MRYQSVTLTLVALLAITTAAVAEDENFQPIDELFQTETVFPQEQGEIGIRASPRSAKSAAGRSFELGLAAEYGFTDAFQAEIEWTPWMHIDPEDGGSDSGQGNVSLALKYSWMDIGQTGFNVALSVEHEFATGDGLELGGAGETASDDDGDAGKAKTTEEDDNDDSTEVAIMLAKDLDSFAEKQIFAQFGVEFESGDQNPFANLGFYATGRHLVYSMEFNWSEEERYITPGVTWRPQKGWELGLGVALGISDEADDYRLIGKIIKEFD
ncbi:MAG: hypothetical protein U1F68_02405 [Gammaproteobacteria bacterium]